MHLAKIAKVDLKREHFACTVDWTAKAQFELLDGKLLFRMNLPDLTLQHLVGRYKALAEYARECRVLKSEIGIAPVCCRLPQ